MRIDLNLRDNLGITKDTSTDTITKLDDFRPGKGRGTSTDDDDFPTAARNGIFRTPSDLLIC